MAKVFISHSSRDSRIAGQVRTWLTDDGHDVFLDEDPERGLKPGQAWEQELYARLRWADAVVCVITSSYLASAWCAAEAGTARTTGRRVLPVVAETDVMHPLLASLQRVDVTDDPVAAHRALIDILRTVDAAGGSGWSDDRSPFPGLRPFGVELHRAFFGRAEDVARIAGLLRAPAEHADAAPLLITGPSGCGKSSLVRAGLIPMLAKEAEWCTMQPMRPGADPVPALVRELAAAANLLRIGWTPDDVRRRVTSGKLVEVVDDLLLSAPPPRRQRLLLVIDQLEELLTQATTDDRAEFAALLRPALVGPLQVVATLRPEFLNQVLLSSELAGLAERIYTLRPLPREALSLVITGPARLAGIDVHDDLVVRLVDDTEGGDALPLLAYTLAQLAEGVSRGGALSTERYDQLDGVRGSLTRQADAALSESTVAGGRSREEVIRTLLSLVTVDEQGRPTRWQLRQSALDDTALAELQPFVARRILLTDSDGDGPVLEVAHEAFLSAWEPLARAITANITALRSGRAIERAATDWAAGGRSRTRLWERGQLASALADVTGSPGPDAGARRRLRRLRDWWTDWRGTTSLIPLIPLAASAEEFLRASIRVDRRRRHRGTAILVVLLLIATTGAGVAVVQLRINQQQQQIATARLLLTQAEAALAKDPRRALQLGQAAYSLLPDAESRARLVNLLLTTRFVGTFSAQGGVLESAAFSRDGRILATASDDRTVALWDLTEPTRPHLVGPPVRAHARPVRSVAFSPNGRLLATAGAEGDVVLWDVGAGPTPALGRGPTLSGHTAGVNAVAFSPAGSVLASVGDDATVVLWDVSDPSHPRLLGSHPAGGAGAVRSVALSRAGTVLAAAGDDATVLLWDVSEPAHPHVLGTHPTGGAGAVRSVAFSPIADILAITGDDGTSLWDVSDPAHPQSLAPALTGEPPPGRALAFSPDGRTLVSSGADKLVRVWDVTDATRPRLREPPLAGQSGGVNALVFSSDGRLMASVGDDKAVVLWDVGDTGRAHRLGAPLTGHTGPVRSVAFSGDGRMLAAAGDDGVVTVWDVADLDRPHTAGPPLTGFPNGAYAVAFAPRPPVLAVGDAVRSVTLWDLSSTGAGRTLSTPETGHTASILSVAFAPDGHTLASAGRDGTIALTDVTDPAHPVPRGAPLTGHTNLVWAVTFSPDGRTLASASQDGRSLLWEVSDPARPRSIGSPLVAHVGSVLSVAFSPRGYTLATSGVDGAVVLWDVSDPMSPMRVGAPLVGHAGPVRSVALTPDGHTLASASDDYSVVLWDVADPAQARSIGAPLLGGNTQLYTVAFSRDGTLLATAGVDGAVYLWDLRGLAATRDRPLQRACEITRTSFSSAEWVREVPGSAYRESCPRGS